MQRLLILVTKQEKRLCKLEQTTNVTTTQTSINTSAQSRDPPYPCLQPYHTQLLLSALDTGNSCMFQPSEKHSVREGGRDTAEI